ncbi:MAG TPA: NirA family protein, partial [Planctomycetota bacterium]|nr:NirA family protein [Planctomycetota bacterium]
MNVPPHRADQEGFTEEQKSYLQGFWSGFEARRLGQGLPTFAETLGIPGGRNGAARRGALPDDREAAPEGPEAIHFHAQNRFLAEGKKLSPEEEAKRQQNPLDLWDALKEHAGADRFPKGLDVFRFKFHGLFHVAPAQDAFMCRLRLPNGILSAHQMRGIAAIAGTLGGGYADVTTRANLQIREIRAKDILAVLTGLQELGIVTRGAGADNIRNITGTPTAGIDPRELIDTRPLAHELHHHILNHRELYGLPRKFNIAFDGGGTISALEETNDIGFAAARVRADSRTGQGESVPAGVHFRVLLGGITGHRDFGRDTGLFLEPRECVPVAAAMVRVFIENGDRTDRKKARLKYLLDRWGIEKFLEETQKHLAFALRRFPAEGCEPRGPVVKHGHVG